MRTRASGTWLLLLALVGCGTTVAPATMQLGPVDAGQLAQDAGLPPPDAGVPIVDAGVPDAGSIPDAGAVPDSGIAEVPDPVIFVHGINPGADDFAVMKGRLLDAGWPANRLISKKFPDPSWGCNKDNASTLAGWVTDTRAATGALRVDIVAHSMGSLSSRYFMKNLGGNTQVKTYVTLGGMHHGMTSSCAGAQLPVCVWKEMCNTGDYIRQLNEVPVTPGPAVWVSIFSTGDKTVPVATSRLDGGENIEFQGVAHAGAGGLLEDLNVHQQVQRVLQYQVP